MRADFLTGSQFIGRASFVVLALCVLAGAGCESDRLQLPQEGVRVLHYDVRLNVDTEQLTVQGSATLQLVRTGVDTLWLTLDGPSASEVFVNDVPAEFSHRRDRLSVIVNSPADTVEVRIWYGGSPATGLYAGDFQGERIVYTDAWPTRVAGWLPGVHHPSYPATLSLKLRHSGPGTAVASGRLIEQDGSHSIWELEAPAPTYTFAFAIANYEAERSSADNPITHYHIGTTNVGRQALNRAGAMIKFMEDLIGPYPYGELSTVPVPFQWAGMENAASAFLNARLYADSDALSEVLAHEIIHQWFGNTIAIADWPDLWISEGFTSYLTTMYFEVDEGEDSARGHRARLAHVEGQSDPVRGAVIPTRISAPEDVLTPAVYRKAGSMLHALRLKVGDDAFKLGLRQMFEVYRGRAVSTDEVIALFEEVSDASLQPFFDYWLRESEVPRLTLGWDRESNIVWWELSEDGGTLNDVDFELEIDVDGEVWYVNRREESVTVYDTIERPEVRPVGVMLDVHWEN
jgi:aminopeptidase N